ncbi:MAG: C25 family cysteine peptidase [Planctomycetota bacterium]|nr:C25 family cysteine peptidase [Planctomycetota bacterium]
MRRALPLLLVLIPFVVYVVVALPRGDTGPETGTSTPGAESQNPEGPDPAVTSRVVLDADRYFGPVAADDPAIYADPTAPTWFLLHLKRGALASVSLGAPEAYTPEDALELTVVAYKTHPGTLALKASWGGADLGTQSSPPEHTGSRVELRFDVPADAVPEGLNALDLQEVSPPLPKRTPTDVSKDRGSVWIDSIEVALVGAERPLHDGAVTPVSEASGKTAPPTDVAHLIIAVPGLVDEARRLAAHRTATGTPSAVYSTGEIVGDLRDGVPGVIQASANEGTLRYVLLVGDATYDRTDLIETATIPTPMARSMYNGATSADALYLPADSPIAIGRLPFRKPEELGAYIDRVIAYETNPPAHPSRRMLRFVTNEGRFGALIDNAIEHLFRGVLADQIPPAFDVEVTFASAKSPFLWPPHDMNKKVIDSLNAGSMFFTYVGHGFQFGFDSLRVGRERFPILHARHVPQVDIQGTPPVTFVLACTTAQFDDPKYDGVGEALLKQPRGPIAYWGATRVCHPVANSLVGFTMAKNTAQLAKELRLGDVIRRSWDDAAAPGPDDEGLKRIRLFSKLAASGIDIDRLVREGREMYTLLGDPALKIAYPKDGIRLTQLPSETPDELRVRVEAPFPDGTKIHFSLEKTRDQTVHERMPVTSVLDRRQAAIIRENHRRSNDWALHRTTLTLEGGVAAMRFRLAGSRKHLIAKAWCVAEGEVHQGAAPLE